MPPKTPNLERCGLNDTETMHKRAELEYWNKNLWKWKLYVWILRKIRTFRKKSNEADDRVSKDLELMSSRFDRQIVVADLCSGDGSSLTKKLLRNRKLKIIGIDISKECAKSTPNFRRNGFDCIAADSECTPIRPYAVDVAIVRNSLHHLTDMKGFCREVSRILRPESALLVIEVETRSRISNFVYHRLLTEPNYPFVAREDIEAHLKEEGFTLIDSTSLKVDSRRSFFIHATKILT
jgi:ubiquinone/menaquinone biosynthesis C-methylase UbiE